jgi:selenocysteine lyase/cysteine desulfurase
MDKKIEGHLAMLLEGYESNLKNVREFIKQTEDQVKGARDSQLEMEEKCADLRELLGLAEEAHEESNVVAGPGATLAGQGTTE